MFAALQAYPPDPILRLIAEFRADPRPDKVDLGVGVYKDELGRTPIMAAVKAAEHRILEAEDSKAYIGPAGVPEFNAAIQRLVFGGGHPVLAASRAATVLTPGGCGALRVGAELLKRAAPDTTIWVSDPTWANHIPLLGNAGLRIREYPYYDRQSSSLRFDAMLTALVQAGAGDVVLLHGCCHNPCGADLDGEQWRAVAELAEQRGFLPFVDLAYQGLGDGLDADAAGLRLLAERVPELLVASSCSKNFGLYRERVGSLSVIAGNEPEASAAVSHVNNIVRGMYSMPPSHGGAIVAEILGDDALQQEWRAELDGMRERINGLRRLLNEKLRERNVARDFSFIERERGMFSFLGLSEAQVARLIADFGLYMVNSSRINVAGISQTNVDYVADALAAVLGD
ncbi:MAG: aromatic amino acid aminotransferase [Porticoccaceae bacterium]|nr:aromatic amino acid aminotransferase [Porticoccaceae bacterium]